MTIPNILTVFRILLTPFFIFFLFNDSESAGVYSLIIFTVASFTDAYDGYYARKYNAVSESGKFLDPLADKILASSAFISFAVLDLIDIWMETNLMCLGEKTSSVLNEIKWKKSFLFNPGEEEYLLYKI